MVRFPQALPNFKNYVDETSSDTCYDFAYPIEGYEAPYGKAQLVLINDEEKTPGNPFQRAGAARVCQKISGTGNLSGTFLLITASAFVRNIIYEFADPEVFVDMEADEEMVKSSN